MLRMLIIGPPGCGKGTQADRLSRHLGITGVSTGDVFREHVKNLTPLGRDVKAHLDGGDLVPDGLTNRMVRDRLDQDDVRDGFLLDGYPRNTSQLAELDTMLTAIGQSLDVALQLTADDTELVRRVLQRATLTGRSDDTEDVIRHRLRLYYRETEPVAAMYSARGILLSVDGMGSEDEVFDQLLAALRESFPSAVPD
ncbi:adenylate kinase [Arthrobacter sp. B10-11]|uniref:adenylate kinase n=1 Tax=Arthrobacter sp. B10-11 TaxID=3081160 RepID=UPI00295438B1|nr:adenylate kinase [Arthrobacter sp. B10-11]MDV8147260.1 adenylate kinase [Arthrobacter sp. B10-11]